MYDYEGFGKSSGTPTLTRLCDDVTASYDCLIDQFQAKPNNIVLYGESIGTGITSELSQKRKAGAIILQSPFTSIPEVGADVLILLKLYPSWAFPPPTLNVLKTMQAPHAPLLLIHGMKDEMLTYHYSERIMAVASEPKTLVLLPNAGHVGVYKIDVDKTIPALNKFIVSLP